MPTMDNQRRNAALCGATGSTRDMRVLILGGTMEARLLAERLAERADLTVTLSLAGRTTAPASQAVPVRVGGFGGAQGLADYLRDQKIDVVIDATHPYAATISANAAIAAPRARAALLALHRPGWMPMAGDRWIEVADAAGAVQALGNISRRVFLALGRKEIEPFEKAPQHRYLVRSVEAITPPLMVPRAIYITGRGPFAEADERTLLMAHRIDIIVAKNSGGPATYGKIAAARALGLPVIMLRRPPQPPPYPPQPSPACGGRKGGGAGEGREGAAVATVDDAVVWLDHACTIAAARGV
jgi:precorrin-6A/cobalt-precorrin-6A reductase